MSDYRCKTLTNSSAYDMPDDVPAIRFTMYKECMHTSIDVLFSILNSVRRPYILTFQDKLSAEIDGKWTGIIGDIVDNKSDIGASLFGITDQRHKVVNFAPNLGHASPVSILSGRIYANTGYQFNIFDCFPTELWIAFGLSLIVVAICEEILHLKSKYSFIKLIITILSNIFTFIICFLNQNSKKFSNICCISHLFLYSLTLISIFLMTLFFNSELLSNILFNPLLNIDSFDDLARFLSTHPEVSLISDNSTMTWKLMEEWLDKQVQSLFRKIKSVPVEDFDFEQVYRGKSIIISFDDALEVLLNENPNLKFHMSSDRHFITQYGFIYSKHLKPEIKQTIDRTMRSVYETGLNIHWILKGYSKWLNISDNDDTNPSISMKYFKRLLIIFPYIYISIIIFFFTEIVFKISSSVFGK